MNRQEHGQFAIYAAETAIPGYQRAWVWGLAALVILLCGLAAGWMLGGMGASFKSSGMPATGDLVNSRALLDRQQAINEALRTRITQLEQALNGDACDSSALPEILPPRSR